MEQHDLTVRNGTYALFVELGRAPTTREVAQATACGVRDVLTSWHRLHNEHALVLNRVTAEIRMANPFSAVPSA